jgi:glucokinase
MCFGVAGPVVNGGVKFSNLSWVVDAEDLKRQFTLDKVTLLNDFTAIGYGIQALRAEDLVTLQVGKLAPYGIKAYLGAGTGLGMGFVTYDDSGAFQVYPTEGGRIDFTPTDDEQIELLKFLHEKWQHVSFERVLSRQGLVNIYHYVQANKKDNEKENLKLSALLDDCQHIDVADVIVKYAIEYCDPMALKTLNIFIRIYGAAIGNLALMTLSFAGLYIVGGIAPTLLPVMKNGVFFEAFSDKGRMANLIKDIPLYLVSNTDIGLNGATLYAKNMGKSCC